MSKPALGKGIRDLLPKKMVSSVNTEKEDVTKASEELKVSRERFSAQGYDVSILDDLKGQGDDQILKGMEAYRDAIKQLTSAQTVIRSIEGYGYVDEIAALMGRIRDPSQANEVVKEVEELKERAFSEHNLKNVKKEPRIEVPEDDTTIPPEVPVEPQEEEGALPDTLDFNADELDGLLDDLDGAFPGDLSADEPVEEPAAREGEAVGSAMIEKITKWSEEGYSVDHLMAAAQGDQEKASADVAIFEKGLSALSGLRERFDKLDRARNEEQARQIEGMFLSPHRFEEISRGIDELESAGGEGDLNLLDLAKEAYRKGDLEIALERFHEVLEQDPSNAKAKFMIRRISQKM
ncbi:MAG: hypothetical protein KAH57_00795 [Thermoplasmata archaeon]|nr:hypothetical protein [Thermoplasmata archaeon]